MSKRPARLKESDVDAVAATASYRDLLERHRRRIRESQARAARALNTELVMLYWSIGRDILTQQEAGNWGDDVVGRIAEDLAARRAASPAATSSTCAASPRSGPTPRKCHQRWHKSAGRHTGSCSTAAPIVPTSTPGTPAWPRRTAGPCATSKARSTSASTNAKAPP
jgi:hypothetical protein